MLESQKGQKGQKGQKAKGPKRLASIWATRASKWNGALLAINSEYVPRLAHN